MKAALIKPGMVRMVLAIALGPIHRVHAGNNTVTVSRSKLPGDRSSISSILGELRIFFFLH